MPPVLFLDANVPIYAFGRPHRLKDPCLQVLRLVAATPAAFLTNSEVLQELLHFVLSARIAVEEARRFFVLMQGRIEPIYGGDVERAAGLAPLYPGIEARDLVHAAVMERLGLQQVISADRRLSRIQDVTRLDPTDVDTWSRQIGYQ